MEQEPTNNPLPEEIHSALQNILQSQAFRGSKRCHDFLRFVVTETLEGSPERLKERTLAIEVFGRKPDAELGVDSIVRVGAREVRKRLTQYYSADGAGDTVRIELPSGSYVPAFRYHAAAPAEPQAAPSASVLPPAAPSTVPLPSPSPGRELGSPTERPTRRSIPPVLGWIVAACFGVALLTTWLVQRSPERGFTREFEQFWRPALEQPDSVLIVLAHPIVYHPSTRATHLDQELHGIPSTPQQRALEVPPGQLNGSDFVPVFDQYTGLGDTIATFRLGGLFDRGKHSPRVRLASKVEFADLRESPSILIGAFTNRWALELTKGLRFRFVMTNITKPAIEDTTEHRTLAVEGKSDDGRSAEDYILLCRLAHPQTGGFLVIGAGLTQYGTAEAGRILAQPAALTPLLQKLPPHWEQKNLELVLHTKIVGDDPTPPEPVAWHVW